MRSPFTFFGYAALVSLMSIVHAAPAQPDEPRVDVAPSFNIDLTVVGTRLVARDSVPDITVDHALEAYDFFGDESWAIGMRPTGPAWIHESRWKTLMDDRPINTTATKEEEKTSSLESRQYGYGYGSGYSSYPSYGSYGYAGYYGYGSGYYGYYAKRDGEKRQGATCPTFGGYSGNCNAFGSSVDSVSMYVYNFATVEGWVPKMNVYSDTSCNNYMTSVLGAGACVSSVYSIRGVITFNQQL